MDLVGVRLRAYGLFFNAAAGAALQQDNSLSDEKVAALRADELRMREELLNGIIYKTKRASQGFKSIAAAILSDVPLAFAIFTNPSLLSFSSVLNYGSLAADIKIIDGFIRQNESVRNELSQMSVFLKMLEDKPENESGPELKKRVEKVRALMVRHKVFFKNIPHQEIDQFDAAVSGFLGGKSKGASVADRFHRLRWLKDHYRAHPNLCVFDDRENSVVVEAEQEDANRSLSRLGSVFKSMANKEAYNDTISQAADTLEMAVHMPQASKFDSHRGLEKELKIRLGNLEDVRSDVRRLRVDFVCAAASSLCQVGMVGYQAYQMINGATDVSGVSLGANSVAMVLGFYPTDVLLRQLVRKSEDAERNYEKLTNTHELCR